MIEDHLIFILASNPEQLEDVREVCLDLVTSAVAAEHDVLRFGPPAGVGTGSKHRLAREPLLYRLQSRPLSVGQLG